MSSHDEGSGRELAAWGVRDHARAWTWSITLGLVGALVTPHAHASPPSPDSDVGPDAESEPSSAAQWYAQGIELAGFGQFEAAADAFLRSYELKPTPEALFNAGLAYQNAGEPIPAIEIYRRVLAEPVVDPSLSLAAESAITELLRQVGTLKGLRYAPSRPPVELYVSGRRVDLDELPLLLPPGPLVIEVVDADGERGRETYELAAGEALVLDLRALLPEPEPEPGPDPDPGIEGPQVEDPGLAGEREGAERRQRQVKILRTSTWVGLGLTGAAGLSYATLAGLAARERAAYLDATCLEFDEGNCPDGFPSGDPEGHERAYRSYRTGAIVSVAMAGGFAVSSLVVGLISLRLDRRPARSRAVHVSPHFGGITLEF